MVSIAPPDRPLTVGDLAELPDDGMTYELIWEELSVTPAPIPKHQRVSRDLVMKIHDFIWDGGLGEVLYAPVDVHLDKHNVVQPDIVAFKEANRSFLTEDGVMHPPDLVVEILSQHGRSRDLVKKRLLYANFGIAEYWIVDPQLETIHVYVLEGDYYADRPAADGVARSRVFPGLEVDSRELFDLSRR